MTPVAVTPVAGRRVPVSSSAALSSALRVARPGDTIELAPGHAGNSFDGSAVSGRNSADSVLDVKGVCYRVLNNRTTGSSPALKNGFQTHVITDPATSGCNNVFSGNTFAGVRFAGGQPITLDKKCSWAKGVVARVTYRPGARCAETSPTGPVPSPRIDAAGGGP